MQLFGQLNPGKPVPGFGTILTTMIKNDGTNGVEVDTKATVTKMV